MNKEKLILFINKEIEELEGAIIYNKTIEKDNIMALAWLGGRLGSYKQILKYIEKMEKLI